MGRRDEWKQVMNSVTEQTTAVKSEKEMETIPEKACGLCKNFLENAYASDGRGSCKTLKIGSDITVNPPVLVTEGDNGLIAFFNTDASRCAHFNKMELIDTDGTECADPSFRRMQRQMEKVKK